LRSAAAGSEDAGLTVVSVSRGQSADLDEVVGEDAVSAPDSGTVDAGEVGAVPAVTSLEVVDPPFGSGSPFDLVSEGSPVFELAAGDAGFASARDRHTAHAERVKVEVDRRITVAAVSGHCPWWASGAVGDSFDRWCQLRCVGGVSDLDGVVEDDYGWLLTCSRLILLTTSSTRCSV
jgi:hypothetical protein